MGRARTRLFNSAFVYSPWVPGRDWRRADVAEGWRRRLKAGGQTVSHSVGLALASPRPTEEEPDVRAWVGAQRSFPHSTSHLFLRTTGRNHPSLPSFHLFYCAPYIYYTSADEVSCA